MRKGTRKTALPPELAERLRDQLGAPGLESFLSCLGEEPASGLRLNPGKGALPDLARLLPFPLAPIPWAAAGFSFPSDARPGKLPFYQAGLYYLQEPSAMAPAAVLGAAPGEKVLDLCAAPGGKTTQLSASMAGGGLLVANDLSPKRIKPLIWNLEHWGAANAVVLNEDPACLAAAFPGFFDKILVDAPCSGEGMLRKEPKMLESWRRYNGQACRDMQDRLLAQAALMLRPGGRMAYSTCTFNPQENEGAVGAFLRNHTDFHLLPPALGDGWQPGRTYEECRQLWPHLARGEGQFVALMEKAGAPDGAWPSPGSGGGEARDRIRGPGEIQSKELAPFLAFMEENLTSPIEGPYRLYGGHIYKAPDGAPDMAGLKVGRPGWYLGLLKNGRFQPSQAMALGMEAGRMKRRLDLDPDGRLVERYLRGETLMAGGEKGWTLVTLAGYPLGFGKQTGDYLKNAYPKGWRLV